MRKCFQAETAGLTRILEERGKIDDPAPGDGSGAVLALSERQNGPAMPLDPDLPAAPGSGLFGLDTPRGSAAVWVQPVPFDATTSFRRGAALGPAAVLAASHQVDLFDLRYGRPWKAGVYTAPLPEEVLAWNAVASAGSNGPPCSASDICEARLKRSWYSGSTATR